jgi:hypothetical protein
MNKDPDIKLGLNQEKERKEVKNRKEDSFG